MTNIEIGPNVRDRDELAAARDWRSDESGVAAQHGRRAGSHAREREPGSRGRKAPPGVGVVSVVVRQLAALQLWLLPSLMPMQCCVGLRRAILQCIVGACKLVANCTLFLPAVLHMFVRCS